MPVHLLRMPPIRAESAIGAILSESSGPATTVITRSVARRAQDAHTNTPPTTPAHLFVYGSGFWGAKKGTNAPNKELTKGGRTLDDGETDGLNVKLEEDSRDALAVTDFPFIMRHTVLVRMQRFRAWCDVCGWDDSKVVLICDKICKLLHASR